MPAIAGPAGQIEALLEAPRNSPATRVGVICHPHPLHEGTMMNKVVHTTARALNDLGIPALRFNFRGVGASEGQYADGVGETDDALEVVRWAAGRYPGAKLWLAGFSFGALVSYRVALETERSQQDELCRSQARIGSDSVGELQSVHPRHPHVQDRKIERVVGRDGRSECGDGLETIRRAVCPHAQ